MQAESPSGNVIDNVPFLHICNARYWAGSAVNGKLSIRSPSHATRLVPSSASFQALEVMPFVSHDHEGR
jgi:hypothetical protein